jgi:hypothetical protein
MLTVPAADRLLQTVPMLIDRASVRYLLYAFTF